MGYKKYQADHSLFSKRIASSSFTALLVYVDDVILCGNDLAEINSVKVALDSSFRIKDLGNLKYFLGFEIAQSSMGISICQWKYTLELLEDAGCLTCKPISTQMSSDIKLTKDDGDPYEDISCYRRLIGQLIYLTNTHPNICFAVHHLSQFLSRPLKAHFQVMIHILKCLKGSPCFGLFFPSSSTLQLKVFCGSDWASCPNACRSTTSFCVFLGQFLISWKSKK